MNSDWPAAIQFVLRMEGEYTLDPKDPGGETKWGISKKSYPSLDILNLTVEQAKEIYQRDFWAACSCDDLPTVFACVVFDTAVNQGTTKAKRILQMTLGVDVDGIIGPKTIAAAAKADPRLAKKFLAYRMAEYIRTITKNNDLMAFAVNWSYRVLSLWELVFDLNKSNPSNG